MTTPQGQGQAALPPGGGGGSRGAVAGGRVSAPARAKGRPRSIATTPPTPAKRRRTGGRSHPRARTSQPKRVEASSDADMDAEYLEASSEADDTDSEWRP